MPALAWTVTLALLLASGGAYRIAEARFVAAPPGVRLPAGTLAHLPLQLAGWSGQDVPLDERIIQATRTDDHLNRRYRQGGASVFLWVAYGVRLRDLLPHRPEVCYVGAGWMLERTEGLELKTSEGLPLPCQLQFFRRGGLEAERTVVLNYFLVSGQYSRDVELLRKSAWRAGARAYSAQMQVSCPGPFVERGEEAVRQFAAESAPAIRALVENAVAQAETRREHPGS